MILALDVGGSSIKYAVFNKNEIIKKDKVYTPQSGKKEVISSINKIIHNSKSDFQISKVGIGFPSVVTKDFFVFVAPNIPDFINVNLREEICNQFPDLEIIIDNDANAAALAELKFGNGLGLTNLIYVTLGSGVGGSIIINKSIYYGDTYGAGEIGYSNFNYDENENKVVNRTGIFEEYLGRKQFTEYFNSTFKYKINSPQDIFDLAEKGNEDAIQAFNYYGKLLGIGIASLMNILDIHSVIIGGGLAKANQYFKESLNVSINNKKLNHISPNIKIAKYLDDTGIYGAMSLVDN